jgi:hypothetical protein
LKLIRLAASAAMSRAPEAMTVPLSSVDALAEAEFLLDPRAMPFVAAVQADQQVGAGLVADVGGAAFRAAVEAVLQLGRCGVDGDRIGRQQLRRGSASGSVAGSIGKLPGNGGTSCGEPGPVPAGGNGGGGLLLDMVDARSAVTGPAPWP